MAVQSTCRADTINKANRLKALDSSLFRNPTVEERFVLDGSLPSRGSGRGAASTACIDECIERASDNQQVRFLNKLDAPAYIVVSEIAHCAYEALRQTDFRDSIPKPREWMEAQDVLCQQLVQQGVIQQGTEREFRHWARVARLMEIMQSSFERSVSFDQKLVAQGLPTIYIGRDRDHTATLSAHYMNAATSHLGRLYGVFACNTSNSDMYPKYTAISGNAKKFGVVGHLNEYALTNLELDPLLREDTYPESFVFILRQIWDAMGIPQSKRLEIDGLHEDPEKIAAAIEEAFRALHDRKIWGHVILGLGPEKRPHVGFIDDLGDPPQYFIPTRYVELSEFVQKRDIERGQQPHTHAISMGTETIVRIPSAQQTWFVDRDGDPSKSREYVHAMSSEVPHRHCSTALSRARYRTWVNFTDEASAQPIIASGLYDG